MNAALYQPSLFDGARTPVAAGARAQVFPCDITTIGKEPTMSMEKTPRNVGELKARLAEEMADLVMRAAEPYRIGDKIKAQMRRAYFALNPERHRGVEVISPRRVRALWHKEAGRIDAHEADYIRTVVGGLTVGERDRYFAHVRSTFAARSLSPWPQPRPGRVITPNEIPVGTARAFSSHRPKENQHGPQTKGERKRC